MGFWDFISPDLDGFKEALNAYVPDEFTVGPITWEREQLLDQAYNSPASLAGTVVRGFFQNGAVQAGLQGASISLLQAIGDNLQRGGVNTLGPATAGADLTQGAGMAQIVIANTYRATVRMSFGGQDVENTFHFTGTGSGQEQACATALQSAWKGATKPFNYFDSKCSLREFEVVDLSSINGGIWVITDTASGGATTKSVAGRQTCALITYNGQTRNRSSRGRTYFGPLYEPDIDVDGATILSASRTVLEGYFTQFRSTMSTAGFTQCVLSRTLVQTFPITLARCETIMATQRRRLR